MNVRMLPLRTSVVALLGSLVASSAEGQTPGLTQTPLPTIRVADAWVNVNGGTVEVPILVKNDELADGVNVILEYDPEILGYGWFRSENPYWSVERATSYGAQRMMFLLSRVGTATEEPADRESELLSVTFYLNTVPSDAAPGVFFQKTPVTLGMQRSPLEPGDSFFFLSGLGTTFHMLPTRIQPGVVTVYYDDGVELGWGAITEREQEFVLPLYLTCLGRDEKLFLVGVDYDELFLNVTGVTGAGPTIRGKPSESLRVLGSGRVAFQVELLPDFVKSISRLHVADILLRYSGQSPPDGELLVEPLLLAQPMAQNGVDPGGGNDSFDGGGGSYGEASFGVVKLLPSYFVRGNVDSSVSTGADGTPVYAPDLADAHTLLRAIFIGDAEVPCMDAADVTDDGTVDLSDAISLLNHLYRSGPPPTAPYPFPGVDAKATDDLECERPLPYFVPMSAP